MRTIWISSLCVGFFWVLLACPAWATPAQAAPTQAVPGFCELAALPALPLAADSGEHLSPEDLLNRVADSYRGLLEFAGDEFLAARLLQLVDMQNRQLEKFFEPVAVAEQRSVALNTSLARLGDWVLLDAEDQGLAADVILARLRETVREHLDRAAREQESERETREERRTVPGFMRLFLASLHGADLVDALVLDGGTKLMASGNDGRVTLWDFKTFSFLYAFDVPEEVRPDLAGNRYPLLDEIVGTDEVLVSYGYTNRIHRLNWRTLEVSRQYPLPHSQNAFVKLSPSGKWMLIQIVMNEETQSSHDLLELDTGRVISVVAPREGFRVRGLVWSADGLMLSGLVGQDNPESGFGQGNSISSQFLQTWSLSPGENGETSLRPLYSAPVGLKVDHIFPGADSSRVVLAEFSGGFRGYRLDESGLHEEMSIPRPSLSLLRTDIHLRRLQQEFVTDGENGIEIWNAVTGASLASLPHPSSVAKARILEMSPSGRYLLVGYRNHPTALLWDLQTRKVAAEFIVADLNKLPSFTISFGDGAILGRSSDGDQYQIWNLDALVQESPHE